LAADPIAAHGTAGVTVLMSRPEAFTDFKATCIGMDERTRGLLAEPTQFIRGTGERDVPEGGELEVTVVDVDMAGEFETWRGPQACSVRILLANDPLRYEKNLLLDWFEREFAGRAGGPGASARPPSGSGGVTK